MNPYQEEQIQTLTGIRHHLARFSASERAQLSEMLQDYLYFRSEAARYLADHFSRICTQKCYTSRLSACCSREGIITFFADVAINALLSTPRELDRLTAVLHRPNEGFKCIYLTEEGCLWRLKPIVCEMFLCDDAQTQIFSNNTGAKQRWEEFKTLKKTFTWPDRPVLFDALESRFMAAGCTSPLMYMHNSPGLL